jgi:hypothetical protein
MRPRPDIRQDDAFKITAAQACEIKKYIEAMRTQILQDQQRPSHVRAAITEKYGLLKLIHGLCGVPKGYQNETYGSVVKFEFRRNEKALCGCACLQ